MDNKNIPYSFNCEAKGVFNSLADRQADKHTKADPSIIHFQTLKGEVYMMPVSLILHFRQQVPGTELNSYLG